MKRIVLLLLGLILASSAAEAKLNVVATTADLGAIAKEIGGDNIDLVTLGKPAEDPRFVAVEPGFIGKLSHADVLLEGGADLEIGWLPALLDQARNSKIIAGAPGRISCAIGVPLLDVPASPDRSLGDIHRVGNPHYVIAPSNAKIVAKNIADGFCANDQKSTDVYRANLKKFDDEIDAKLVEWKKKLAPFRGRSIAACDDSWPYFAKEFGLRMDVFLETRPGIPPSPARVAEVIMKMKEEDARAIIVDPYFDRKTAEAVARNTNAWVVEVTQFPGGLRGTEGGYIQLVDYLVNAMAKALTGFT